MGVTPPPPIPAGDYFHKQAGQLERAGKQPMCNNGISLSMDRSLHWTQDTTPSSRQVHIRPTWCAIIGGETKSHSLRLLRAQVYIQGNEHISSEKLYLY